jgi:PAS domain S-box-containing protein
MVVLVTLGPLTAVRRSPWTLTFRYVAAGGLLWFAGNALLAAVVFLGLYRAGLSDVPWSVPFVWLAAAASVWRPARVSDTRAAGQPWKDTRRGLAVALAAVGMVPTLHLATSLLVPMEATLWRSRTAMALTALVLLGILFAARQLLVVRGAEAAERQRARQLERIEARFQQAFRHSPAAMAIVRDGTFEVVDVNQRCGELLDLPRQAVLGASTADLLIRMPTTGQESLETLIAAGRRVTALPLRLHTRAGAPLDTLVSVERIEVDGQPAALLLIEDVRAQKGLEEQLVNSQKMDAIGRLAGGIAHEFNNLLTAIINAGSLACSEIDRPVVVAGHLDRIDRASYRAASLTRQLLAFGRRQALRPEILDLSTVIDEMRSLLPSVLGEDIRLDIAHASRLSPVRADRSQVKQVILNLAANARDAMPMGGRLAIGLTEHGTGAGHDVVLSVTDDGVGMSEQAKQHLFEPFFTTKDRSERGGLGLAAVYGIVAQSGGRIDVDSTPGRGTTVRIFLPAMDAAQAPSASPAG